MPPALISRVSISCFYDLESHEEWILGMNLPSMQFEHKRQRQADRVSDVDQEVASPLINQPDHVAEEKAT
jgi:hypothetical protein